MAGTPRPAADQRAPLAAAELERVRRLAPDPNRLTPSVWNGLSRQAIWWVAQSPDWLVPERLGRWSDALLEFLARLERDLPTLVEQLGVRPGPITRLRTGCSDPHHGGRTVIRVRTEAGPGVYYKPRDGRIEAEFYRLMEQLASPDLARPPRLVPAIDCCWAEDINAPTRDGPVDLETISRSAGALLALLDLVQAADLHPANLAHRGNRLVPIDLETVSHPTLPWENPAGRDPADPVSVLRVGMIGGPEWPGVLHARPLGDGFREMYHVLESEPVERFLSAIAPLSGRVLLRATARYRTAWRTSRAAGLADRTARSAALERALSEGPGGEPSPVRPEIRSREVDALADFDIPRFTARPGETAVTCSSTGRSVAEVCASSGLARVEERRRVQGEADLAGRLEAVSSGLALELMRAPRRRPGGKPA